MEIKPIRNEEDYRSTLREIASLLAADPGSPEGDRLDVLTTLVEAYERSQFPMDLPDPAEAIRYLMSERGLSINDLEPALGSY